MRSKQNMMTRVPKGNTKHAGKGTRQSISQFPQKLYEIVNDPKNDHLIRWADSGDSFFVFDEERLARDILGHWFKHEKFSSLVRQLNLYGFRKIPHLQQGVLRQEAEFSNYAHAHFLRDKPEMLCLIQRQKPGDHENTPPQTIEHTVPVDTPARLCTDHESDMQSIVSDIAAIKHYQITLNKDLHLLKNSNQHLWKEAMASRDKHKTQQDTIDRILKFLAGVFGPPGSPVSGDANPTRASVPRVSQKRIGNGSHDRKNKTQIIDPMDMATRNESPSRTSATSLLAAPACPVDSPPSLWPADIPASSNQGDSLDTSAKPFDGLKFDSESFLQLDLNQSQALISSSSTQRPNTQNFGPLLQEEKLQAPQNMERLLTSRPSHTYAALNVPQSSSQIPFNGWNDSFGMSELGQTDFGSWLPLLGDYDNHLDRTTICAADIDDNIHALERDFEAAIAKMASESNVAGVSFQSGDTHIPGGDTSVSGQINGDSLDQDCNFDALLEDFTNYDRHTEINTLEFPAPTSHTANPVPDSSAASHNVIPPIVECGSSYSRPETSRKRKADVAILEEEPGTLGNMASRPRLA